MSTDKIEYYCSFCGRHYEFVEFLLVGPETTKGIAYICNICVYLCVEVLDQKKKEKDNGK
jgi:ATP-dependent protease Clp ATPase subunit